MRQMSANVSVRRAQLMMVVAYVTDLANVRSAHPCGPSLQQAKARLQ